MKKQMTLWMWMAAAAVPATGFAADASLSADVLSAYVFYGQVANDEAVFQPALDVEGPLGLAFSLWANMNLTDNEAGWYPDTAGKWSELDLGLSWTAPWEGPVSLTVGANYFVYPQDSSSVEEDEEGDLILSESPADGDYEVFIEGSAEDIWLSPTLLLTHALNNQDDWVLLFSVGHSLSLSDALSLDLDASLGYAGDYYVDANYESDTGAAFTHVEVGAALNYAFSEAFSVGLKGAFSSILDGDIRDDIQESDLYPDVDIFFGGLTASYSF